MQLIEGQNLADLIGCLRATDPAGATGRTGRRAARWIIDVRRKTAGTIRPPRNRPVCSPTSQAQAAELTAQHSARSARFFRTAARIAVQAADALEHAHQFGVVHRDVKPANLIVDERGNVWVTDFGLAQFHTGQGLTRTGDLMGTLRYMSPEQAGGLHAVLDAAHRRLLPRRNLLRVADAAAAVRRHGRPTPAPADPARRAAPAALRGPQDPGRAGNHRPQGG